MKFDMVCGNKKSRGGLLLSLSYGLMDVKVSHALALLAFSDVKVKAFHLTSFLYYKEIRLSVNYYLII